MRNKLKNLLFSTIFLMLVRRNYMVQAAGQDVNGGNIDHSVDYQVRNTSKITGENANLWIRNTTIVDVIGKQILTNKDIIIVNGKIDALRDSSSSKSLLDDTNEFIDGSNYIALPGFINTHTHLWQHISKSVAPKEPLQTWIKIYRPVHYLTKQELSDVVLAASCEALLSGITTVSDYASLTFNDYGFETNAESILKAGLNGVLVWNNPSIFLHDQIKVKEIDRLRIKYRTRFDIWMGFGPLSFYSIPVVYSGVVIASQLGMPTTEHTMENIEEQRALYNNIRKYLNTSPRISIDDQLFLRDLLTKSVPSNVDAYEQLLQSAQKILELDVVYRNLTETEKALLTTFNRTYLRRISPLDILNYFAILEDHLAIHSVWLQKEDIDILKKNHMPISHNPESNMYLTSGIAPIDTYLKENISVTIGTDGAASNDGINFFSAMREMWNVYKIKLMNTLESKKFDEWNIIQAATINGARALKIDRIRGSIDAGKQGDIILLDKNELGLSPLRPNTVIPLLIYSANARNVKYVISNGIVRVENGTLKYETQSRLAQKLTEIANNVDSRINEGKMWTETYIISDEVLAGSYWYKYQSIRKKDTVRLNIQSEKRLVLCIAVSGDVFGGGTSLVIGPVAKARFPENPREGAFFKRQIIDPLTPVLVEKESNSFVYKIVQSGQIFVKTSEAAGQLLITAFEDSTQFADVCRDTSV